MTTDGAYLYPEGQTSLCYSPDGRYLYTVGASKVLKKFTIGVQGEPKNLDIADDENTCVAASLTHVLHTSQDGTVSVYSAEDLSPDKMLLRTNAVAARYVAISPDSQWAAVASDDSVVKVVNILDNSQVQKLDKQTNSNMNVAFHPTGNYIAVSCMDGCLYVYSLSSEQPELVKKVDGMISKGGKVAWCPDGRAIAGIMPTGDVQVIDRQNWERQRSFSNGHTGAITDIEWSPNGAFLASGGRDGKVIIWESKGQTIVARHTVGGEEICSIAWHPKGNTISFTTGRGRLFTKDNAVPEERVAWLKRPIQPAPLINDTAEQRTTTLVRGEPRHRAASEDSLDIDAIFEDNFVDDDDGAGYAEPAAGQKRNSAHLDDLLDPQTKRRAFGVWSPTIHESFQPSSTPWRGKRRYMCLNMVGFVWTVDQDGYHTVTMEFHDRESRRDLHFTDPYRYDKACLSEYGALFACNSYIGDDPSVSHPAMLYYRPHETWTNRAEWKTELPQDEEVVSIALSENYVVACTSSGYIRIYTLCGVPFRIYRAKHAPVVTCASYRNYVITMGNGPVGLDGRTQLTYVLENVKRGIILQNNDIVALPPGGELKSAFFSEDGNPMIYDSDGVLLVLQHWREPGAARWVPLLDTKTLERLVGGGKEESYWPVAVAQDKFHCIILKGGEKYPYFPRPLLSEFDFKIPLTNKPTDGEENSPDALEELYLRESILYSLQQDSADSRILDAEESMSMAKRVNNIDRALLQLVMVACKEEAHGARALEICGLFKQKRTLDVAIKAAIKYNRTVLANKIAEMRDAMETEDD